MYWISQWMKTGDLRWILIRERVRDDSDPFASSGEVSYRYRLWTREEWFLFSVHFKDKGKGFELSNVEFTIQTDVHELARAGYLGWTI